MKDPNLSKKFPFFTKEEKKWVLKYLSSGKGTIPYELISDFDSLSIAPEDEFFKPHQFFSSMKDSVLSEDEYENVKKFYTTLKLSILGELNQIFRTLPFFAKYLNNDLKNVSITTFQKIFKLNPCKCNSARSFSGRVHRDKSNRCIALPTDAELVRAFKKTLVGEFSCVNTRLAFDTEISMNDYNKEKLYLNLILMEKNKQNVSYLKL